jgi:hypothetical protein
MLRELPGCSADKAGPLECQDHLVHGRRCDGKKHELRYDLPERLAA